MTQRKASDIIEQSIYRKIGKKWVDELSDEDKSYLMEVVVVLRQTPNASRYVLARKLVKELGIKRSHETVARTLRELADDAT